MVVCFQYLCENKKQIIHAEMLCFSCTIFHIVYITFITIIIKKDWQCKAGRGRLTPYQSEDSSPTLPTYRGKEEKEKIVEDKKGESN